MGYLEAMWHFTGRYTPQGNIGKYSDPEIEAWIEWQREPGALMSAFVEAGWIDQSKEHRLLVHDWHDHADDATRLALKRKKLSFSTTVATPSGHSGDTVATTSGLPEPEPEPVPEPVKVSEANASSPRRDADGDYKPEPDELIYGEYPRKEGHGAALKAISKAVDRIRKGEGVIPPMEPREARVYLYRRVQCYARSPAGSRADKSLIPHPATWFNQSRYLDDESNWQAIGGSPNVATGTHQPSAASGRIDGARRVLAEIAIKRGWVDPPGGNGRVDEAIPIAGRGEVNRGVPEGFRAVGVTVLDGKGTTRPC